MAQYNGNYDDENGRPVEGASVFVYDENGFLAAITDTDDNPVTQPILTDADGNFSYRAPEAYYQHVVWFGGRRVLRENEVIIGPSYRDAAQSAAAAALAAAGVDSYADTSAGLAGTSLGETFWVNQGDGTGKTYRHDAGPVATEIGTFIKDVTDTGAASNIGKTGGGTVQDKLDEIVSVKDFGAVGSGSVNDATAIQAAIDAVSDGGVLILPPGTYRIDSELTVDTRANITFRGDRATIVGGSTRFRSYFYCDASEGLLFEGLTFDQRGSDLPGYVSGDYDDTYNCPVYFENGDGLTVRNCTFSDLYTLSIFFKDSSNIIVDQCNFDCPVSTNDQWLQFVHLQTYGGNCSVTRSRFVNATTINDAYCPCAVFASGGGAGSSLTIQGNFADYCGRDNTGSHRLGVFDIYGDAQNVLIADNVSINTMSQFVRLSSTRGGRVTKNRVTMSANCETGYAILSVESVITFSPGQVGAQDVEVSDNLFEDTERAAYAVGVLSYDWGAPATGIRISRNDFVGVLRSVYVAGPFNDIQVVGNHSRQGRAAIEVIHNGTNAANVTATVGTEVNSRFDNLLIADNVILNDSGSDASPVTINLSKSPQYTGTVGRFAIKDNSFRKAGTASGSSGIAVIFNASSLQGRLTIEGNETNNYNYDWYVRGTREIYLRNNRAIATGTAPWLDDGTNGQLTRSGNSYTGERQRGSDSLVAGTVTISSGEIRTGDYIRLTRRTVGGTPGNLSYTIVNATSFTINSDNVADTSTVDWEIVH